MYLIIMIILPLIGSLVGYIVGRKNERLRNLVIDIITGMEFLLVIMMYPSVSKHPIEIFIPDIMGIGLYLKMDMMRYIFVLLTCFIWFLTTIYSTQYLIKHNHRNRYYAFFMLTLSSTVGVFISENILNLFTFFEMMAFTSYMLVIHDDDVYSHEAGKIYLGMSIASGMITLMGILLLFDYTNTLNISEISSVIDSIGTMKYTIGFSLMIGFAVKACMFPLHVWLPKVYPAAPTPATAVLSGILAKAGVYGIMIVSICIMGNDKLFCEVLLILAFVSMFIGGFLAMFQRNIKRILAYSSMSQIGYILMGVALIGLIGEHKEMAIYGTMYHIVNHGLFKVLLFMIAGIIYMILDELSINKIRGFGKHKNLIKVLFLIGMFGVIGMPGFNGFISKTMLHHALSESFYEKKAMFLELLYTVCSSFTVAYLLKIFVSVFVAKNDEFKGQYKTKVKKRATIPMIILSLSIIYIAINPSFLIKIMNKDNLFFNIHLNGHFDIKFYSINNIKSSITTILMGVGIYVLFIRRYLLVEECGVKVYKNPSLNWFNLENNFYRPVCKLVYNILSIGFSAIDTFVVKSVKNTDRKIKKICNIEMSNVKCTNNGSYKVSDIPKKVGIHLNSITYSVFIIGFVLVIITIILIGL
ncbi:complex I subunit 5 family protein [Tepidibacter hydrothermalis]|uniref:Proton-conducting transporter membrane subunit n=1 Tax=Tepidibacter hydrothermalis TaxID=3036126 RepID=A0ABY8EC05_9FIRM|nr:proton-conducting transporter membrane subunit [Tepidibacter hydrothermalis]WFD09314.1 proton-conducting transporter membrane subunit [Tepidibacter hydrothermalis]